MADAGHVMEALAKEPKSPRVTEVMAKLSALADIPVPSADGAPQVLHHPTSLKSLDADFAKLEEAVDGADADPSADAQASYVTLTKMLDTTLASWEQMKRSDLAALNAGAGGEKSTNR